jgi:hypothetical protein
VDSGPNPEETDAVSQKQPRVKNARGAKEQRRQEAEERLERKLIRQEEREQIRQEEQEERKRERQKARGQEESSSLAASALSLALIHPGAWKVNSAHFAFTEFSETRGGLAYSIVKGTPANSMPCELNTLWSCSRSAVLLNFPRSSKNASISPAGCKAAISLPFPSPTWAHTCATLRGARTLSPGPAS